MSHWARIFNVHTLQVYYSYEPLLINLKHMDSSYLTFDQNNLPSYKGSGHPIDVFAFSAYSMNIVLVVNNAHFYGYHLSNHGLPPNRHREVVSEVGRVDVHVHENEFSCPLSWPTSS